MIRHISTVMNAYRHTYQAGRTGEGRMMSDFPRRSGWCIEHESPEVFSFGDTPRGFCIQNDYEDYCNIVPLFTRQEFVDSDQFVEFAQWLYGFVSPKSVIGWCSRIVRR